MASSEPPYLPIGTDVSAKYRGAFCEAKVKKIVKSVKCRVFLKETQSSLLVTDEFITGTLQLGATVEVKHPDTGRVMEATIKQMSDSSMYTVVFDDADERTLRRTQLCLKGDKHFMESETLDNLPLSNPEHFGTPVISRGKRGRSSLGTGNNQEESESSSEEDDSPRKKYRGKNQELVGKLMFYESGDRKKSQTLPVLVVLPDAHQTDLKNKDHVLIRSFKDGKYLSISCKDLKNFSRETVLKNEDKSLKPAMEKALLYVDNRELPVTWNKEEMLGSDDEDVEDEEESEEDDDEISEEKDRFVAQLYKFSDDRGTPINKGPSIGSKDLNLYKLFKVVQKYGGYNRVTNQMKWRLVYSKMQLPPTNTASTQMKNAYKKYLHAFEDFYRKLGSSMGTISRPSRSRNDSGRGLLNFRGREAARTPDKTDSDKEKLSEDTKSEFDSDAESLSKQGTPKRPKSARTKVEKDNKKAETKEKETKEEKKADKPETKKDEKKETKKTAEDSPKKTTAKKSEEKKEVKLTEVEKKALKRKEDGSVKEKSDTEEELKDLQKKIGRRRSMKTEEKIEEDKEEPKKDKKEEKKDEVESDKKDDGKKKSKKKTTKTDESGDTETEVTPVSPAQNTDNLPVGSKLRVRYGKGKNIREYEAKILEVSSDGPASYLVHYQGWNTRHDEWVGRERIMKVLERPDSNKAKKAANKPSPKPGTKAPKKKSLLDKPPASPSSVKSDSSSNQGPGRPTNKSSKSSSPSVASAKPRPTRSNSIELVADSLPAKRRKRKVSSVYDSTNGSDSEDSGKSDTEMDTMELEKQPEKSKPEPVMKSTSMPSIASEKPEEDISGELDSSIDRSPPKLMKQVDLVKEELENEAKSTEKEQVKEEQPAPVLNVVEEEKNNDEPILQKLEAQLNATSPVVTEKPVEVKEKEVKKKETERRGRKPLAKVEKEKEKIESEVVKKVEKEKEETVVKTETEKPEESPFDFKDEPDLEAEGRISRKKISEQAVVKEEKKEVKKPEVVTEIVHVLKGSLDDSGKELAGLAPHRLLDDKDAAKSDSEVERRGRKKKVITVKDPVKTSVAPAVSVNSEDKTVTSSPSERKPFITLAEKKQGFSPIVRKVIPVAVEKSPADSAKVSEDDTETEKSEKTEEVKKVPDMVVVHKMSPVKSDIVVGKKVEPEEQVDTPSEPVVKEEVKEEENDVPAVKKKVRKKTKKKIETEEQEVGTRKVGKRGPGRKSKEVNNKDKDLESASASKENSMDIDLRCEEQIRSRSASPETVIAKSYIQESQGFVPRIETIDCRISDSQGSDSFSLKHDKLEKSQSVNKSNVFENTPPTTPERDSDDASQQNGHSEQIKTANKLSEESGSKTDTSQNTGSESPIGNASPSNRSTGSSSGVIAGSEGSIDVPVYTGKRRRESDEPTPTKRRKRASRGKSTSTRARQLADSDSEDFSKGRSPQYSSDSYPRTASNTSPRPPKFNLNLEEGKYLEGTERISFLVEKITEIRKLYMNLKSEVACIDRRRKKLRRKEREREAQSSSAMEMECS